MDWRRLLRAFILTLAIGANLQLPANAEVFRCHEGKGAETKALLTGGSTHEVLLHVRGKDESQICRSCLWTFTMNESVAIVLVEKARRGPRGVLRGDVLPNVTVTWSSGNGTEKVVSSWGDRNLTVGSMKRGDTLRIELMLDNASAATMDNSLELHIHVLVEGFVARSLGFIYGQTPPQDCSMLLENFIWFSSIEAAAAFYANNVSSAKDSPFVMGVYCSKGVPMYMHKEPNGSLEGQCLAKEMSGQGVNQLAAMCRGSHSGRSQFIAVAVLANGTLAGPADVEATVVLQFRPACPVDGAFTTPADDDKNGPGPSAAKIIGMLALVGVVLIVAVVLWYLKCRGNACTRNLTAGFTSVRQNSVV